MRKQRYEVQPSICFESMNSPAYTVLFLHSSSIDLVRHSFREKILMEHFEMLYTVLFSKKQRCTVCVSFLQKLDRLGTGFSGQSISPLVERAS